MHFEALSDRDINLWIARQDGYLVEKHGEYWDGVYYSITKNGVRRTVLNIETIHTHLPKYAKDPTTILDLCERWEYKIVGVGQDADTPVWLAYLYGETPKVGPTFARALLNAVCEKRRREINNGS